MYTLGYLGLVPVMTPIISSSFNIGHFQAMFSASICASLFAITLSHPFDTIKTNLQGDIGKPNKKGVDLKVWGVFIDTSRPTIMDCISKCLEELNGDS